MLFFTLNPISLFSVFTLTADPNTLFRSNSLSSKAMEQFMKVSQGICFIWSEIVLFVSTVSERMTLLIISNLLVPLCLPEHLPVSF